MEFRVTTLLRDNPGARLSLRFVVIHDEDFRTTKREAERCRSANATATASDQRDFSREVHVCSS